MLYLITIILKTVQFEKKINLDYLELDKSELITKVKSIKNINTFIVYCKLTMIMNLSSLHDDNKFVKQLSSSLKSTFDNLIQPFLSSLETIMKSDDNELKSESIFAYDNHIKNLLRYSHHEVEWVNVAFNMEECYKQLIKKVNPIKEGEK